MRFPEVANPGPLLYDSTRPRTKFSTRPSGCYHAFKYARYTPLDYYKGDRNGHEIQSQGNLAKFMKILTIKRLESSFTAFRLALDRFIKTYERVIEEFDKGTVSSAKSTSPKFLSSWNTRQGPAPARLIDEDKAEKLDAKDFKASSPTSRRSENPPCHPRPLEKITRDPKWNSFRDILKNTPLLKTGKLIIFTESKETADTSAAKSAMRSSPKPCSSPANRTRASAKKSSPTSTPRRFAPRTITAILVATEVLAEGVNLHRSNVVINYDIPWNPTRLIQRVGRVNRVDTKFDKIHTYNFFPTDEGNDLIKLREAAEAKIHAFIQMLGADARLLTEGEEIVSHDLFANGIPRRPSPARTRTRKPN